MNKDQSIKQALDSKVLNKTIHKDKYHMPNIEILKDSISQHLTNIQKGQRANFSILDNKYACSQLQSPKDTTMHSNFNIICGDCTGTYRYKTLFYGLMDMPAEFPDAKLWTIHLKVFKTHLVS